MISIIEEIFEPTTEPFNPSPVDPWTLYTLDADTIDTWF